MALCNHLDGVRGNYRLAAARRHLDGNDGDVFNAEAQRRRVLKAVGHSDIPLLDFLLTKVDDYSKP